MKPAKKLNSNKNVVGSILNEKDSIGSAPGIKTYFKITPKPFVIHKDAPDAKVSDDAKQFYVDVLKKKLRRVDDDSMTELQQTEDQSVDYENQMVNKSPIEFGDPHEGTVHCAGCVEKSIEIEEWKIKYNKDVAERKEYKKLYLNSTASFTELYSKYNDLLKTTAALPVVDQLATPSTSDIFTPNELKYLQCMPFEKSNDCSFILCALKFAYKADLSIFLTRTLFGTAERTEISNTGESTHHPAKLPMTPSKVRRIRTLFIGRLSKCRIDPNEYAERMNEANVNKLFAAGIRNLSRRKKHE